jgi:hypothetical protein
MKYEGYYIAFFIFIGLLLIIFNYNIQQQQIVNSRITSDINAANATASATAASASAAQIKQNKMNIDEDHIRLYREDAKYKKLDNTKDTKYTYNIDNIDIRKDTIDNNNSENKLGNPNRCLNDPELDEIYNTSLRGDDKYKNIDNEIFNYSIKPNKTDLPIVNAPMHLLLNGAPLRLSERHLL